MTGRPSLSSLFLDVLYWSPYTRVEKNDSNWRNHIHSWRLQRVDKYLKIVIPMALDVCLFVCLLLYFFLTNSSVTLYPDGLVFAARIQRHSCLVFSFRNDSHSYRRIKECDSQYCICSRFYKSSFKKKSGMRIPSFRFSPLIKLQLEPLHVSSCLKRHELIYWSLY